MFHSGTTIRLDVKSRSAASCDVQLFVASRCALPAVPPHICVHPWMLLAVPNRNHKASFSIFILLGMLRGDLEASTEMSSNVILPRPSTKNPDFFGPFSNSKNWDNLRHFGGLRLNPDI